MDGSFILEEVRPSDKEEVTELCKDIWGGYDYIPEVFDRWIEEGGFFCGRAEGRIVALSKYTRQRGNVLWLEGLRVHPEFKGRGYGKKMSKAFIRMVDAMDHSVLRFMTAYVDRESVHLGEEAGFKRKAEYHYLEAEGEGLCSATGSVDGVQMEKDVEAVERFVFSSEEYRLCSGLYLDNWTASEMDQECIRGAVETDKCFSVRNEGQIMALAFYYSFKPYNAQGVAFIAGEDEPVAALIRYGMRQCSEQGGSLFTIMAPSHHLREIAEAQEMGESDIGHIYVYEKRKRNEER
ncbi:MAG: GNAT family N-acetyltransferase [Thermoplasmata archaeon]|nr:GNAT family N-acetyltransferase [Thermoplasmata archaeon]